MTQESGRVPARYAGQIEWRQRRPQRHRFARKLVTELHTGKPGLLRFRQAGLKRYLAAKLPHVVIGPANRIGPDPDRHCSILFFIASTSRIALPPCNLVTR